jgi:hypothetical protein
MRCAVLCRNALPRYAAESLSLSLSPLDAVSMQNYTLLFECKVIGFHKDRASVALSDLPGFAHSSTSNVVNISSKVSGFRIYMSRP